MLIGEEGKKEVTDIDIVDDILEGLGPRYSDWAGSKPVPIDGDLLLGSDTVFKKPFRLLPYGMKPGLSPVEITELRHLVRHLPPHFVLGRNKDLRGVAAAIVKLWEKIEVAKVAVKRGVLNTNNERIAIELKRIAGGTLLYRDKQCFVLYRGKDFLPPAVQAALEEREAMARSWQEDEERVRMGGRSYSMPIMESPTEDSKVGTLVETLEAQAKWTQWKSKEEMWEMRRAARKAARLEATRKIQSKVELVSPSLSLSLSLSVPEL
jgi:RNA-binding protein YhbY